MVRYVAIAARFDRVAADDGARVRASRTRGTEWRIISLSCHGYADITKRKNMYN